MSSYKGCAPGKVGQAVLQVVRFSVASARLLHQFTSPIYHIRDRRSDAIRITSPFDGKRDVPDPVDSLILDLLEWIGPCPRPYSEVIDA